MVHLARTKEDKTHPSILNRRGETNKQRAIYNIIVMALMGALTFQQENGMTT